MNQLISRNLFKMAVLLSTLIFSAWPVIGLQSRRGADEMYADARSLAFNGKRKEARDICVTILEESPGYVDARLLLGNIYLWDGEYEQARQELKRVLESHPDYIDATYTLIEVEKRSARPADALQLCDVALRKRPNDEILLYKKAQLLESAGELTGAATAAKKILVANPSHQDARVLLNRVDKSRQASKLGVEYGYEAFDRTFDPWHSVSLSLSRRLDFGSLIGRINYAYRFNRSAVQYEADAYPALRSGTYMYMNAGYSPSSVFPRFRFGAEVFQRLPRSFEASAGLRHLRFSSSDVTIFTGSFGKYRGNYWLSFRPYVTPNSIGSSFSGTAIVRRYFEDAESYVTMTFGAGSFPDERNTTLETFRLRTAKVSVDGKRRIGKSLFGYGQVGFDAQELPFGASRKRFTVYFGIEKLF